MEKINIDGDNTKIRYLYYEMASVEIENLATINVRGISEDDDRLTLVEDAIKYKCKIIAVTETHIPDKEMEEEISILDDDDKEQRCVSFINHKPLTLLDE